MARAARDHGSSRQATVGSPNRQHAYERASLCGGRKRGAFAQAIGISRGGRSNKLHALTDGEGRPFRFLLTPSNVAHARAALQLLNALPPHAIVLADKAYDGGAIRALIEEQGAVPTIPPKINRKWRSFFFKVPYRGRNAIEQIFCRRKDWRRIATSYDKLATNIIAAICLAAAITWWL